jgi:hypothetical protein
MEYKVKRENLVKLEKYLKSKITDKEKQTKNKAIKYGK